MSKKRINYYAKEVASYLHTHGTQDLKKKVQKELENTEGFKLTAKQLIEMSSVESLISIAPEDPQAREDVERKKEAKLIDKVDAKFGAKYEDT